MLIQISYCFGDISKIKSFYTYEGAVLFIRKLQEVNNDDFLHFDFYVYRGKEEIRVRGINPMDENTGIGDVK